MKLQTVGSLWLQEHFKLTRFVLTHRSYIGQNARLELTPSGEVNQVYGPKYVPASNTVMAHLEFSLKYDDLHLAFLQAVFVLVSEEEIVNYVATSPTGKYARKIGFLYEFLTGRQVVLAVAVGGNYVDLLEEGKYFTGKAVKVQKWRINNNLLGTAAFCPIVRKTSALADVLQHDLRQQVAQLKESYDLDTFSRAIHYLYSKETRSSYEIEKEKPPPERMERFIALLSHAGREPSEHLLGEENLTQLQNAIVDPRFAASGYRDFQNYIGQTLPNCVEMIHFICPPPEFVLSLMEGLKETATKSEGTSALVRATVISFGFVFIHPFEDGNGRLQRFLIHDMLVRDRVVPDGLIIPVSAHMLSHMRDYNKTLENYSIPLMRLVQYTKTASGELEVINKNEVEGYFRYPDLTDQTIFLAHTIQSTITDDIPQELAFIQRYDEAKRELQQIVDMPDKELNLMILLLHQNKGSFPKRRRKDFAKLTDDEIERMEQAYRKVFDLATDL
ncbi:Fic family protein [Pontibacter virosus]|uniref:Fic/DOC family protein n=1 Tax=Pontibacter virosus TaxID=1765052 RepID=A0A2U1AXY9_9BACT|nr:Fic family protein [Pontibacter virosus]PVY41232.1 Fic/DOC family protein [Pontibacter virosus]